MMTVASDYSNAETHGYTLALTPDERKHIIYIACPGCAKYGLEQQCSHPKSSITLFSDSTGTDVLQGRW